MVLRDERGDIIYIGCRKILTCDNDLGAELAACREGLKLALHRSNLPIMMELDYAEGVSMLLAQTEARTHHRLLVWTLHCSVGVLGARLCCKPF